MNPADCICRNDCPENDCAYCLSLDPLEACPHPQTINRYDPDYIYLPNDWRGHVPVNRVVLEVLPKGAVCAIPANTTLHMDMMRMLRKTKAEAYEDARLGGNPVNP